MGRSAHCRAPRPRALWCAGGRRVLDRARRNELRGEQERVSGATAVVQPDLISLLALRQRAIRFWLAAIGLVAFGAGYLGPIALAIRAPSVTTPVVLPALELPTVTFPSFAVPALHAAPVIPAVPDERPRGSSGARGSSSDRHRARPSERSRHNRAQVAHGETPGRQEQLLPANDDDVGLDDARRRRPIRLRRRRSSRTASTPSP